MTSRFRAWCYQPAELSPQLEEEVGLEPTTARFKVWSYYHLSYSPMEKATGLEPAS